VAPGQVEIVEIAPAPKPGLRGGAIVHKFML
jgi:hypothetical protein